MADIKHEVPFSRKDKVTKETNGYAGMDGEVFNDSEKNASQSRLYLVNKQTTNSGKAYNGYPIPETYKRVTSHEDCSPNIVVIKKEERDQNT